MRNRKKLTREEAIEEYIVCRQRTYECLHIFQIADEIIKGQYQPSNDLGHDPGEFLGSLRTAMAGLFASLMDTQPAAINIFDVWLRLFPEKENRIKKTWQKIEPQIKLIRKYRNNVAFHANKDVRVYFETYYQFRDRMADITTAMQEFWNLAAELIHSEGSSLPNLRKESEPALRRAFPKLDNAEFQKVIDHLIGPNDSA